MGSASKILPTPIVRAADEVNRVTTRRECITLLDDTKDGRWRQARSRQDRSDRAAEISSS
jgi:hypothetical protein